MIFQKGLSFFLLPVYTNYLSPTDYGIQAVVVSVSSFLSMFIALGLDTAAQRYYYRYKTDNEKIKKIYGTASTVIIFNSLFFGGILIVLHKYIIDPIIGEVEFYPYVILGIAYVMVNPLYILYQSYLQTKQDGKAYGFNSILYTIIYITITLVLLVYFRLGVIAILLSQLLVSVIFFIYVSIRFLPSLILGIDKDFLHVALKYSLPILPHTLANWSNDALDKLFVNKLRDAADTGVYGIAQQVASVTNIIANAINQAYLPWFFQKVELRDNKQISVVSETATVIMSLFALFLSLFAKEILDIMISNPLYVDVFRIVPFLVFSYTFQLIYFFFIDVLFVKNTEIVFLVTVTSVIINICLNLILIPLVGIIGAAVACAMTFFLKSFFALIISKISNKEIRFNYVKMYVWPIVFFIISIITNIYVIKMFYNLLIVKLVICLSAVLFVYLSYRKEIDNVRLYLMKNDN